MKLLWHRFQDWFESFYNRTYKRIREERKHGEDWENKTRSGRRFTRVEFSEVGFGPNIDEPTYRIRPEPGWEWTCQNCKTYSLIKESDMPAILKAWEELAAKTVARGYKPPVKPTAATAGCTNCRFLPGSPE